MDMRKPGPLFFNVMLFIIAQLTWFALLGLWIYWYVTNYLLFSRVEDCVAVQVGWGAPNLVALIGGLVLLILLSVSMSLIFIYLTRQMNLNRLYDNFIANVTHELKSPLSSLQLYLETMRNREVPKPKRSQFMGLMLNEIDRLNHLINSILYLSSLEKHKHLRRIAHDYHVYEADEVFRSVIREKAEEFNLSYLKVKGRLRGQCVIDITWLKIVFHNLMDNAVKYSRDEPELVVNFAVNHKHFIIDFHDRGVGIAPKDQKKIFNKFERIADDENPNVRGTGLGLFWVREILRYHGGKIKVNSEGRNRGATFRITLPVYRVSKKRYIKRLLRMSKKEKKVEQSNG